MQVLLKVVVLIILSFGVAACDSSNQRGDDETVSYDEIVKSPAGYTSEDLISAYRQKITSDYDGFVKPATMDLVVAQKTINYLYRPKKALFLGVDINSLEGLPEEGDFEMSYTCLEQGSVNIFGTISKTSISNYTLVYSNCSLESGSENISGKEHIKYSSRSDAHFERINFFEDIKFSDRGKNFNIAGYRLLDVIDYSETTSLVKHVEIENVLITSLFDLEQFNISTETNYHSEEDNGISTLEVSGTVTMSGVGEVEIRRKGKWDGSHNGIYELTGELKSIKLDVQSFSFLLSLDDNGDEEYDYGIYLSSFVSFQQLITDNITLVNLDVLSLPPRAEPPRVINEDFYHSLKTSDPIILEPSYYSDSDSPQESLTFFYKWYLNGNLIEGQHTNELPAYQVVYGDSLKATIIVSDEHNTIESSPTDIVIGDSPGELFLNSLPVSINAGDTVVFTPVVNDPDNIENKELEVELLSGPTGTSLENGVVTWQTGQKNYFSNHEYQFVFANPYNEQEHFNVKLSVTSKENTPFARSGVEIPYRNYSTWIGDFTGNGENEVLSTDNQQRIFLLSNSEHGYQQSWMYPYTLPTEGKVQHVMGANVDEDNKLEILVVTEYGISLIDDINNVATVILKKPNLQFAAIADSNLDGSLELAYIINNDDKSSVHVVSFNDPTEELFNNSFINSKEVVFANVDGDESLELITNSGMIFDGHSWENEWLNISQFGDSYVATGGLNGDGINEIAGADDWGNIVIYSAGLKEQITELDNLNTCSIIAGDIDDDMEEELVVGDCGRGTVRSYDLIDDVLVEKWSVDMKGNGSKSLALGDSDNDGKVEIHWGEGQGSSGKDLFITAEVKGDSVSFNDNVSSTQLNSYSSAGWVNQKTDNVSGVFFIPKTNRNSSGSRVLTLDFDGNQVLSEEISSNWDRSAYAAVSDFNNDGESDIVLPLTEFYNGSLGIKQLSDMSEHWSILGDSDVTIGIVSVFDLNKDSFDDAIYVNGSVLNAVDINHQTTLMSHDFGLKISDFTLFDNASDILVAVAKESRLSVMQHKPSGILEVDFKDADCLRVEFGNFDEDIETELVCLSVKINGEIEESLLTIYDVRDLKLIETNSKILPFYALDLAVDTSTTVNQEIFISLKQSLNPLLSFGSGYKYHVAKLSSRGELLWQSPGLVGQPTHRGLKFEHSEDSGSRLMLSTSLAMYLLQN